MGDLTCNKSPKRTFCSENRTKITTGEKENFISNNLHIFDTQFNKEKQNNIIVGGDGKKDEINTRNINSIFADFIG